MRAGPGWLPFQPPDCKAGRAARQRPLRSTRGAPGRQWLHPQGASRPTAKTHERKRALLSTPVSPGSAWRRGRPCAHRCPHRPQPQPAGPRLSSGGAATKARVGRAKRQQLEAAAAAPHMGKKHACRSNLQPHERSTRWAIDDQQTAQLAHPAAVERYKTEQHNAATKTGAKTSRTTRTRSNASHAGHALAERRRPQPGCTADPTARLPPPTEKTTTSKRTSNAACRKQVERFMAPRSLKTGVVVSPFPPANPKGVPRSRL